MMMMMMVVVVVVMVMLMIVCGYWRHVGVALLIWVCWDDIDDCDDVELTSAFAIFSFLFC